MIQIWTAYNLEQGTAKLACLPYNGTDLDNIRELHLNVSSFLNQLVQKQQMPPGLLNKNN